MLLVLKRLLAREGEQPAGQVRAPVGRIDGGAQTLGGALVMAHQLLDQLQIAHHDHQQVVEVMGDAAGQLADRFHLLGLEVFAFKEPAIGDALAGAEDGFDSAIRSALGFDVALEVVSARRKRAWPRISTPGGAPKRAAWMPSRKRT